MKKFLKEMFGGGDTSIKRVIAFLGFLLVIINLNWIGIILSIICTRYRDLGQLVSNVMNLLFFVTPILWRSEMLNSYQYLLNFNLFYHLILLDLFLIIDR